MRLAPKGSVSSPGVVLEQFPLRVVSPQGTLQLSTLELEDAPITPVYLPTDSNNDDDFAAVNKGETSIAMNAM